MVCLFSIVAVACTASARAEEPHQLKGKQTAHSLERAVDHTVKIDYLLYLPEDYSENADREWPLMLFLHGAGERGDDLSLVKKHGPPMHVEQGRNLPFILVSPQCPKGEIWKTDVLIALLDAVQEQYAVDPDRIYLTGLSMGGYGTWELAASYPDRFAAIAPICGGGSRIWAWPLQGMPVWAFHGGDDPVVSPEESKRLVEALKRSENEAEVKLTIYPDVGHASWIKAYDGDDLYDWLLQQRISSRD